MNKNSAAILLLLPAVAGCIPSSVKGMQERAPVLAATSQRSVQQISECVSAAWLAEGITPKVVPRPNGVSMALEQTFTRTLVMAVLDLDRQAEGTLAEYRQFKTLRSGQNQRRIDEVRGCL